MTGGAHARKPISISVPVGIISARCIWGNAKRSRNSSLRRNSWPTSATFPYIPRFWIWRPVPRYILSKITNLPVLSISHFPTSGLPSFARFLEKCIATFDRIKTIPRNARS